MEFRKGSAFDDGAVFQKLPGEGEFRQVGEVIPVPYPDDACLQVDRMELDVLVDLLCLGKLRRGPPVRSHKPVAAEVPIVRPVPEVPSIVELGVRTADLVDALVHPVPDAGAYHPL